MDKSLTQSSTILIGSTKPVSSPWINAWRDAVIGFNAYSQSIQLSDLRGDGDYKFLVSTPNKRLIAYKGASLDWETHIMDTPVAVATFYSEVSKIRKKVINIFEPKFYFFEVHKLIFK